MLTNLLWTMQFKPYTCTCTHQPVLYKTLIFCYQQLERPTQHVIFRGVFTANHLTDTDKLGKTKYNAKYSKQLPWFSHLLRHSARKQDPYSTGLFYSNFWHPGTLTLSPGRQSAQMLKITNDGLTRSGTECSTAVRMWQQWASEG